MIVNEDQHTDASFAGELASIDAAQHVAAKFCAAYDAATGAAAYLPLVLEELITNSVQHGQARGADALSVSLQLDGTSLLLTYADNGIAFDPRADVPPDPRESLALTGKVGGLGWPLIQHYFELVSYTRENQRNVLQLRARAPTHAG